MPFFKRTGLEELFFKTHPLDEDETIIKTWVAAVPIGGIFSKHGGNLVLTNKRLLIEPLKIPSLSQIAKYLAPFEEHEGSARLSELARVESLSGTPARLRVVSKHGKTADFLILSGRFSLVWSRSNLQARDDATESINNAIKAASA